MDGPGRKADLHRYLQIGREALLWKLDGLCEYDVRRPMVKTGTNLLGLLKHVATVDAGYFGVVFDRPFEEPMPWIGPEAEPNADMWANGERDARAHRGPVPAGLGHSDATIDRLELDASGRVPWWPEERRQVTLHRILVHLATETHRHAGHADIVRELIDGAVGLRPDNDNMAHGDDSWWSEYRDRLERVALDAIGKAPERVSAHIRRSASLHDRSGGARYCTGGDRWMLGGPDQGHPHGQQP